MTNYTQDPSISRSLGRIEGKQDLLLSRLDQQGRDQEKLNERQEKIEDRVISVEKSVSAVEKRLSWYTAYFAGGMAVLYIGWSLLKEKIVGVLT